MNSKQVKRMAKAARGPTLVDQYAECIESTDGNWLVLVRGVQWGGKRDASGAGDADAEWPTKAEAIAAYNAENEAEPCLWAEDRGQA